MKQLILLLFCTLCSFRLVAQWDSDRPVGTLATPSDAFYTFYYYTEQPEHYNPYRAAKVFYRRGKGKKTDNVFLEWDKQADRYNSGQKPPQEVADAQDLAIKLKQILDGKGIRVRFSAIPEDSSYRDSITRKYIYTPFPYQLPDIYLERAKLADGNYIWRFSSETMQMIPKIHQQVYPWGSDKLLTLLPKFGESKILGLAVWQYITIVIVGIFSFLSYLFVSWLLGIVIRFLANSRLGRDHFDPEIVKKIARTLGYLSISYLIYVFIPIIQLPVELSYYIIVSLRVFTTICIILLSVRTTDLAHSYFDILVKTTLTRRDDHLLVVVVRLLKAIIWVGGVVHIFGIFDVNVTALIAGLSIGGLAIALAAQETVKNLIGSAMIYADKPFQIGDLVRLENDVEGSVIDVGFRSTRIRLPDTSIVSIPNGGLADKTVINLGAREKRRFKTNIGVPYHTPPDMIEQFLLGIRMLHDNHPKTYKQESYVRLNNFTENALTILLIIFFETNDYREELACREEMILGILKLAYSLGIRVSFPSSAVFIESQPEKQSNLPDYNHIAEKAEQRTTQLVELLQKEWKTRYPDDPQPPSDDGDQPKKPPIVQA